MYLRQDDVFVADVGDDCVLLDNRASTYITLNPAAALLVNLLQTPTTRVALVEALVTEFGIDTHTAETDSEDFLEQLRRQNLLIDEDNQ